MRWPDGVRCPVCGNDKVSRITRKSTTKNVRKSLYQCLETTCKQQFSATSGTIFNDSHLPLHKWFMAIAIVVDAKKGISANQLKTHLGIGSYRTAWYMAHRIRKAMENPGPAGLFGTVEVDETSPSSPFANGSRLLVSQCWFGFLEPATRLFRYWSGFRRILHRPGKSSSQYSQGRRPRRSCDSSPRN